MGPAGPAKLNTDDPEVREFLFGVAEHWLRFGIDGWRLDVPEEIADETFWQEFRARCRAIRPDAYLVGEIWRVAPEWVRGDRRLPGATWRAFVRGPAWRRARLGRFRVRRR